MTLAEIMTQPPITVRDDATVDEVAARMIGRRIGCLPVVNHAGQLVGIVTTRDFGAKQGSCPFPPFCAPGLPDGQAGLAAPTVRAIMTPQPVVLPEDASVVEAVAKMLHLGFDHIPVVRDGVPVGVVAREDLLRLTLRLLSGSPRDVERPLAAAEAGPRAAQGPEDAAHVVRSVSDTVDRFGL